MRFNIKSSTADCCDPVTKFVGLEKYNASPSATLANAGERSDQRMLIPPSSGYKASTTYF